MKVTIISFMSRTRYCDTFRHTYEHYIRSYGIDKNVLEYEDFVDGFLQNTEGIAIDLMFRDIKQNITLAIARKEFMREGGIAQELMANVWHPKNMGKFKYLDPDTFGDI